MHMGDSSIQQTSRISSATMTHSSPSTIPTRPDLTSVPKIAVISPISMLLPELLSEVFQHCTDTTSPIIPASKHAPLLLTRICNLWRHVALSTPRLWAALRIFIGPSGPCRGQFTTLWLNRSGARPLRISFSAYSIAHAIPSMEALIFHAHRWQYIDLDLSLNLYQALTGLVAQTNTQLSTLGELRVHLHDHDATEHSVFDEEPFAMFRRAGRLNTLHLDWAIGGLLGISYQQLTSLNVTCRSINDLILVTQQCQALLDLNVVYDRLPSNPNIQPRSHNPTNMPKLRFLRLYLSQSINYGSIFDLITAPALEDLQIEDPYHLCPAWPLNNFVSLVHRSSCSIKRLYLSRLAISDQQLSSTLQMVPGLLEFRLQARQRGPWQRLTDEILAELTNCRDGQCLIPNLELLAIERRFPFTAPPFLKMLRSRWWTGQHSINSTTSVRRLLGVHFTPSGNKVKFKSHLDGLKELEAEGMLIVLPPSWCT